jgi:hypothetical protein
MYTMRYGVMRCGNSQYTWLGTDEMLHLIRSLEQHTVQHPQHYVRYEVSAAEWLSIQVFWNAKPSHWVSGS